MAGNASAYAALGLKPGADPAAVERAYKRLIKQYHPDREGGDSGRAAEINRAYRELRRGGDVDDELMVDQPEPAAASDFPWARSVAVFVAAVVLVVVLTSPSSRAFDRLWDAVSPTGDLSGAAPGAGPEAMSQPLAFAAVDRAISDAVRIARNQDEMALANASRDCHHELRLKPSLAQLDRCAAFDDAVVQLQDRDPLRDQGPFSELEVTGRQMSAATLFSNDYLAIDGRLDRIRLRVELVLAPRLPEPVHPSRAD